MTVVRNDVRPAGTPTAASLAQIPTGRSVIPTPSGLRRSSRFTSTPGRMIASLTILLALTVGFGIAGAVGANQRTSLVGSVRSGSGPLAIDAQQLYRPLSDADATAGGEFLYASQKNPNLDELNQLRLRYLNDINTASANLTAAAAGQADPAALERLAAGIPVYTGLVETARADSRLGLPLGAAYLREASSQMRTVLLPAAQSLYDAETRQLGADRSDASGFPWLAIPLGIIALIALIRAQRTMARRTHRIISPGLAIATLTVVVALGWIAVSWTEDAIHLHRGATTGSSRVNVLAKADIDVLRARADEELTLIARGNDPSFDSDFTATMTDLDGSHGLLQQALAEPIDGSVKADIQVAVAGLLVWRQEHSAMEAANATGDYSAAVNDTVGSDETNSPALFAIVDDALQRGIDTSNALFQAQSTDAAHALSGLEVEVAILIAVALIGVSVGYQRRIAEYR